MPADGACRGPAHGCGQAGHQDMLYFSGMTSWARAQIVIPYNFGMLNLSKLTSWALLKLPYRTILAC
jgi:hypothetical protein